MSVDKWWYNLSYRTQDVIVMILSITIVLNVFLGSVVFWRQFL